MPARNQNMLTPGSCVFVDSSRAAAAAKMPEKSYERISKIGSAIAV
jgi:hypothetical protein